MLKQIIKCIVAGFLVIGVSATCSAQGNPTISPVYLTYCSYYYKTTHYPAGQQSYYETIHTSSFKSFYDDDSSMYARFDDNGNVTVLRSTYIPAINNFSVVYGLNTSEVSHHRERAIFAMDFDNPSEFPGWIDVTLRVAYDTVDSYGAIVSNTYKEDIADNSNIMPGGVSGWIEIRPPYMTRSRDYPGNGMWYAFLNNGGEQ